MAQGDRRATFIEAVSYSQHVDTDEHRHSNAHSMSMHIYIILYNDNVSLVAFRAGAHGTSCPPVESEASILIQHPHPAVEQPFGAQKAVVCIDGSRED